MKRRVLASVLFSLAAAACSGDSFNNSGDFVTDAGAGGLPECLSSNECPTGFTCTEFGTCVQPPPGGADAGLGVEVEIELSPPTHSERFVYVAMSELDALAKIDGQTLEVESIAVGDQPEVLAAIPGGDGVVVLDQNNATATIVRPLASGDDTRTVPTLANLNRISVDPSGSFALAWFDLQKATQEAGGLEAVGEIGSFQDVTVIRLAQDNEHAVNLTVGFRPRAIEFDSAGTRAFVVSDDGISVIPLADVVATGPHIVAPIPLGGEGSGSASTQEVTIVSTGEFALVRENGLAEIRVVRLSGAETGEVSTIVLSAPATDVDLSKDGTKAYAVLRDTSELAIVDMSQGLPGQAQMQVVEFPDTAFGSMVLSPQDEEIVLYTNASSEESIVVVSLTDSYSARTVRLKKSIRSVGYDPTGKSLIVTHAKSAGDPRQSGIDFDEFIDRSYGYSIIDLETGFAKLQITSVDTGAFQFSGSSPRAYVLLDGSEEGNGESLTHIINLETGIVKERVMSSPPETVGILPVAGVAFVNQTHALGRVSFINVDTDAMRTVTGFDLNSRVVD